MKSIHRTSVRHGVATSLLRRGPTAAAVVVIISMMLSCSKGSAPASVPQPAQANPDLETQIQPVSTVDSGAKEIPPKDAGQQPPVPLPDYIKSLPFDSTAVNPGALALSADGNTGAHIAFDGSTVIWNAHTYSTLDHLVSDGDPSHRTGALALNADGSLIAVGRSDGVVEVRLVKEPKTVREFRGQEGVISALAFSPSSLTLASGSDSGTTIVWELKTGRPLRTFDSQIEESESGGPIAGLGFSGDSRALVVSEWYRRHYDVGRGTTIWDLDSGAEIAVRDVAPPNNDEFMRSGQAIGANNWLLAYTTQYGLVTERLDRCVDSNPQDAEPDPIERTRKGGFANTVTADPRGRWVAALDDMTLRFFPVNTLTEATKLLLPVRVIALLPNPDGEVLFVLAIKDSQINGNNFFIDGNNPETAISGELYSIAIPEGLQQLPVFSIEPGASRCAPSESALKQWSYQLPRHTPVLPMMATLRPPEELPTADHGDKAVAPPSELFFNDKGLLFALHRSGSESAVVVWDLKTKQVLRLNSERTTSEGSFRLRDGWTGSKDGQLVNLLTGKVLLDTVNPESESGRVFSFATDQETGDIFRVADGALERYDSDLTRLPITETPDTKVSSIAAKNGKLAVIHEDGSGRVVDFRTGKSSSFTPLWDDSGDCDVDQTPFLSADGRFLQFTHTCGDSGPEFNIVDLRSGDTVTNGPILGVMPSRSSRIVVPDRRADQLDIWDLVRGELLVRLPRQQNPKDETVQETKAILSDDGRLVASASTSGQVRVWDIDSKHLVGEARVGSHVTSLAFDLESKMLAVGVSDGKVVVLDTTVKPEAVVNRAK